MALTVTWNEYNGTDDTLGSPTHSDITNIVFGSLDDADFTPASYPITAGENSFAKYISAVFQGQFSEISSGKLWKSAGADVTGETVHFNGSVTKSGAPSQTDAGWSGVPTSEPGSSNVGLGPSDIISGSGTSPTEQGESYMMGFQVKTTVSTPGGALNNKTFTLQYNVA